MCVYKNGENDKLILDNIDSFKDELIANLMAAEELRNIAKENGWLNEQFYIDWEIGLNEISVADPNK